MRKKYTRTKKTNWWWLLVAILILGAAAGVAYYFITRNSREQDIQKEISEDNKITVGSWNTLNFIGATPNTIRNQNNNGKTNAIADIINFLQYDIIGLTEINKDVNESNEQLNTFINRLNSKSKSWMFNLSGNLPASPNTNDGQIEQVLFLYNANKFEFNTSWTYSNPKTQDGLYYVRPPYGASFTYKQDRSLKLGVVVDHFDSPGVSGNGANRQTQEQPTDLNNQGSYEVNDAKNIFNAMNEMQEHLQTDNLLFIGDTNIRLGNQAQAFNENELTNNGYRFGFEDKPEYRSTLSSTMNQYANPYDKIIYKISNTELTSIKPNNQNAMKVINPNSHAFIFDIVNAKKNNIISRPIQDDSANDFSWLRHRISDHAPVGISFVFN
ncbi:endonuclease/exonuclease/phosphatase family protein [[Mycoplasma] testudinis]|uniref:endonuclease/exonuclease/phosphatase family protein n=1 Tax=[Mycoplasma] testudinis TaxID=33924 RepID=UPI00048755C3|nr:endonuclease/exonuclease/phosphatase family protein [[Mycoplasma] testudinis]